MVYTQKLLSYAWGLQAYSYIRRTFTLTRQRCYLTSTPAPNLALLFSLFFPDPLPTLTTFLRFTNVLTVFTLETSSLWCAFGCTQLIHVSLLGPTRHLSEAQPGGAAVIALPNAGPHQLFTFEYRNGTVVYRVQLGWSYLASLQPILCCALHLWLEEC